MEKLQKEIKKEVGDHPLTKITRKDISKAIIGAFIGVISHFSFAKGVDLANQMSMARASLFFVFSFVMGFIFIYTTGYRKIKQVKLLKMIPLRVVVIYIVALVVVFLVLTLFNKYHTLVELYKQMAVISLLAMIGASAADLIGE